MSSQKRCFTHVITEHSGSPKKFVVASGERIRAMEETRSCWKQVEVFIESSNSGARASNVFVRVTHT